MCELLCVRQIRSTLQEKRRSGNAKYGVSLENIVCLLNEHLV